MPDTRRTLSALQTLLADNGAGDISAQDARDELISSHPEKVVQAGAAASRPSSDLLTGDIYMTTDSAHAFRYNGSSWQGFGPVYPMTPPVNGDYSWVNQGSATVTAITNGPITLAHSAAAGSFSWHLRMKTIPTAPYTVTMCFRCQVWRGANSRHRYAIVLRESGTGELLCFYYRNENDESRLVADKYSNTTTFNSTLLAPIIFELGHAPMLWLRLTDNSSLRKLWISTDGLNFTELASEGNTTFLTPDQIGFGMVSDIAGQPWQMTVLSWKEE